MRISRIVVSTFVLIAAGASVSTAQVIDEDRAGAAASELAPPIDLWLDQRSYHRGARMRPYFSTDPGTHVVIVRVTAKGELWPMYPQLPGSQKPYALARFPGERLPPDTPGLYEASGSGFVFAIASYHPFDFSAFREGLWWGGPRLAKLKRFADPFDAVRSFVSEILPRTAGYSLDYDVYHIYSGITTSGYGGDNGYVSRGDQRKR